MASSVNLYPPRPPYSSSSAAQNSNQNANLSPLPKLLHTPAGLALLELQGTINLPPPPPPPSTSSSSAIDGGEAEEIEPAMPIGRLAFPDYHGDAGDDGDTAWMRHVYLYVGQHQRLTGEVKKLPRALAIVQRRRRGKERGSRGKGAEMMDLDDQEGDEEDKAAEELEVVQIVKYKLVFSQRPEPVGAATGTGDGEGGLS